MEQEGLSFRSDTKLWSCFLTVSPHRGENFDVVGLLWRREESERWW